MRRKRGESVFPEAVSTKTVWESWVTRKDHLGGRYSPLPPPPTSSSPHTSGVGTWSWLERVSVVKHDPQNQIKT